LLWQKDYAAMDPLRAATDNAMMMRCIELSRIAAGEGEYPFGTVIALDGQIVAEAVNSTVRESDVTRHAEVIALSVAQKVIGRQRLHRATLYSNIEPCAMCCYCIREAWIGRVVYGLSSPIMGGVSKWNILRDSHLSGGVPIFGPPPEVISGMLLAEAQKAWRDWNPLAWELVKLRGVLTAPDKRGGEVTVLAARGRSFWQHVIFGFARLTSKHKRRAQRNGYLYRSAFPLHASIDAPRPPAGKRHVEENEAEQDRSVAAIEHGIEVFRGVHHPISEGHIPCEDEGRQTRE
jgi:tRNA(adenine34) deaminase